MRVGIATDHGGFALKEDLVARLRAAGHDVTDFGAAGVHPGDDYPDFVAPLVPTSASTPFASAGSGTEACWPRRSHLTAA